MEQEITEKLNMIFNQQFRNLRENIILTRQTSASDIRGWDSLANIMLVVEIERQFGIKFKLAEISNLKNVGDMVDLIEIKIGQ